MTTRRDPETDAQLAAAAAASDRANRPTIFLIAPALVLLGSLVLVAVLFARLGIARSDFAARRGVTQEIEALVAPVAAARERRIDSEFFEPRPNMADRIDAETQAFWSERDGEVTVPTMRERVTGNERFVQTAVETTIRGRPAPEDVLDWIDLILRLPDQPGIFVSKLNLDPRGAGLTGSVEFSRYQEAASP